MIDRAPMRAQPTSSDRLLLDTHVWLWWQSNSRRLSKTARLAIAHAADAYLSVASAWEIAIKTALGKLRVPEEIAGAVARGGFLELPIQFRHVAAIGNLPMHHRDPFDRILIAQATVDALTLITADPMVRRYDVPVLWAGD